MHQRRRSPRREERRQNLTRIRSAFRRSVFALSAGFLAASAGPVARAQDQTVSPTAADRVAAGSAKLVSVHPNFARTPAAAAHGREAIPTARPASAAQPTQSDPVQNPGDLSNQGGAVVDYAQSHALYVVNPAVGCTTASCWGDPEGFLRDLAGSDFIHVIDQYVGRHDGNRYTVGGHARVSLTLPSVPLTDLDMLAVVHTAASQTHQTGYNNIYHIFLPPGTDECLDATFTTCYSPDKPSTFVFCAYHSSADFQDIGHVLYSVEPYQNVSGCNDAPVGSPNGQLADTTNDTLSHELFETITDPDGTAWYNTSSLVLLFNEIGDECIFLLFPGPGVVYGNPPTFNIGNKAYRVQTEYNNSRHACTIAP